MKEKIAGLAIIANVFLAGGKIFVGLVAHSASVLADGIHSGMDVIASTISLLGIKISNKPVDKTHPYGYYKFEVLSGLIITGVLLVTGGIIIWRAYNSFFQPSLFQFSSLALWVMAGSALVNEVMARLKIHYGKKENSLSLLSDGVHSRLDVYSSLVIFGGLIFSHYWVHIDSLLAFLIGLYIIKESISLGKEATDSLLDVSAGEEIEKKIYDIAQGQNIKITQLKTQKKGAAVTANIEIELPSNLKVEEATAISNKLRKLLMANIEPLEYVAIQIKGRDIMESFFQPNSTISRLGVGRGWRWSGRGRMQGRVEGARGAGPEGYCVCENCGYRVKHQRGVPCSEMKCPKCGGKMRRE